MFMLKRTHEKMVKDLVDSHNIELESVRREYEQQLKENEDNHIIKNNTLRTTIKGYEKEIDKLRETEKKYTKMSKAKGGYTKYTNRLEKQIQELENKVDLLETNLIIANVNLKECEDAICEYVKPTHEETRFSVTRHDKKKYVDYDRANKKGMLQKLAKEIHDRRSKDFRKKMEDEIEIVLSDPIEIVKVSDNEYVIPDKNNKK